MTSEGLLIGAGGDCCERIDGCKLKVAICLLQRGDSTSIFRISLIQDFFDEHVHDPCSSFMMINVDPSCHLPFK